MSDLLRYLGILCLVLGCKSVPQARQEGALAAESTVAPASRGTNLLVVTPEDLSGLKGELVNFNPSGELRESYRLVFNYNAFQELGFQAALDKLEKQASSVNREAYSMALGSDLASNPDAELQSIAFDMSSRSPLFQYFLKAQKEGRVVILEYHPNALGFVFDFSSILGGIEESVRSLKRKYSPPERPSVFNDPTWRVKFNDTFRKDPQESSLITDSFDYAHPKGDEAGHVYVYYPKTDWNGAFQHSVNYYNILMLSEKYNVHFRGGTGSLEQLEEELSNIEHPISHLVLGGHGTAESLELNSKNNVDGKITLDNLSRLGTILNRKMTGDGTIFLSACSAGACHFKGNLVEALARAANRTVIGATGPHSVLEQDWRQRKVVKENPNKRLKTETGMLASITNDVLVPLMVESAALFGVDLRHNFLDLPRDITYSARLKPRNTEPNLLMESEPKAEPVGAEPVSVEAMHVEPALEKESPEVQRVGRDEIQIFTHKTLRTGDGVIKAIDRSTTRVVLECRVNVKPTQSNSRVTTLDVENQSASPFLDGLDRTFPNLQELSMMRKVWNDWNTYKGSGHPMVRKISLESFPIHEIKDAVVLARAKMPSLEEIDFYVPSSEQFMEDLASLKAAIEAMDFGPVHAKVTTDKSGIVKIKILPK